MNFVVLIADGLRDSKVDLLNEIITRNYSRLYFKFKFFGGSGLKTPLFLEMLCSSKNIRPDVLLPGLQTFSSANTNA